MKTGDTVWVVTGTHTIEATYHKVHKHDRKMLICSISHNGREHVYPALRINTFVDMLGAERRVESNLIKMLDDTKARIEKLQQAN